MYIDGEQMVTMTALDNGWVVEIDRPGHPRTRKCYPLIGDAMDAIYHAWEPRVKYLSKLNSEMPND